MMTNLADSPNDGLPDCNGHGEWSTNTSSCHCTQFYRDHECSTVAAAGFFPVYITIGVIAALFTCGLIARLSRVVYHRCQATRTRSRNQQQQQNHRFVQVPSSPLPVPQRGGGSDAPPLSSQPQQQQAPASPRNGFGNATNSRRVVPITSTAPPPPPPSTGPSRSMHRNEIEAEWVQLMAIIFSFLGNCSIVTQTFTFAADTSWTPTWFTDLMVTVLILIIAATLVLKRIILAAVRVDPSARTFMTRMDRIAIAFLILLLTLVILGVTGVEMINFRWDHIIWDIAAFAYVAVLATAAIRSIRLFRQLEVTSKKQPASLVIIRRNIALLKGAIAETMGLLVLVAAVAVLGAVTPLVWNVTYCMNLAMYTTLCAQIGFLVSRTASSSSSGAAAAAAVVAPVTALASSSNPNPLPAATITIDINSNSSARHHGHGHGGATPSSVPLLASTSSTMATPLPVH